ncbi:SCO2400 family protein [Streptomyces heilongjiangensis]|uniref:Zinc ribbon domain-containing protein n=1 Tax=Streptomyces heilongjiangensis TaxID=945052 RepID=A0ABW1BB59_9ACTN|nr:hypothetical protein [Streptomyces heilongjiangensis]MDC2946228.1 hypothetical protein [Streptomyces heilongjiangensis]
MDYCSSCRRHLNGALVCPGCGAYAPDIAPSAPGTTVSTAVAPTVPAATWEYAAAGAEETWHDGGRPEREPSSAPRATTELVPAGAAAAAQGAEDVEGIDGVEDVRGVPVAPQGRAARRRQLARWKKNQRRAVVATAVALVGGGLTVMGMDRQSTDRTQAATAPDAENLGAVEEQGSQSGRTPDTRADETRRSPDTSRGHAPGGRTSYDGSGAHRDTGGDTGNAPRTATTPPSDRRAQSGSSSHGGSGADGSSDAPSGGSTKPPATDDSTGSGAGPGSDTGTGAGSGSDTGSGSGTGTGTGSDAGTGAGSGSGADTGDSGGSGSSDSDATSPSGLCLLGGIVCVS